MLSYLVAEANNRHRVMCDRSRTQTRDTSRTTSPPPLRVRYRMRLCLHLERVVAHGARVHIPVRSDAELEFVFILECIPVMLNPRSTLDVRCSSLAGLANSNTTARALDLVAPTIVRSAMGASPLPTRLCSLAGLFIMGKENARFQNPSTSSNILLKPFF